MSLKKEITRLLANNKTALLLNRSGTDESYFCAHRGTSMNPTLTSQDLLKITTYHNTKPAVGDVVLFLTSDDDSYIVHRIVRTKNKGFLTRGDNCEDIDPWVLSEKDIHGRVIAAHRANKRRTIAGGYIGKMTGLSCFMKRKINWQFIKLFRPVYRSLCTGGILHWLIPVRMVPNVATYRSGTYSSHKLLLGKRIIGSYDDTLLQWQIKRPYRLVVDENSLPVPGNSV
jgi:hypothetical protein